MRMTTGRSWALETVLCAAAVAAVVVSTPVSGEPSSKGIALTPIGVYRTGHFDGGGAEIAAYDPQTHRVFVVNLEDQSVDVLDISDPAEPSLRFSIDVTPYGSQANSVAVHDPPLRRSCSTSTCATCRRIPRQLQQKTSAQKE
jgi:hypothetical protein